MNNCIRILGCYCKNLVSLSAHVEKYELVQQIIQHVEYSGQMARVFKSSQNVVAPWENLLT